MQLKSHSGDPIMRLDANFKKAYKMEKVVKFIYDPDHLPKWDAQMAKAEVI